MPATLTDAGLAVQPLVDILAEIRKELRDHIAKHASGQARRVFGGDRVYISRRLGEGTSERNAAIKRDYWQGGEHIPLLERRYGLSSSHIWRIIKS